MPNSPASCDRPETQLRGHAEEVRELQRAQLQQADEDRVQENVQDGYYGLLEQHVSDSFLTGKLTTRCDFLNGLVRKCRIFV